MLVIAGGDMGGNNIDGGIIMGKGDIAGYGGSCGTGGAGGAGGEDVRFPHLRRQRRQIAQAPHPNTRRRITSMTPPFTIVGAWISTMSRWIICFSLSCEFVGWDLHIFVRSV